MEYLIAFLFPIMGIGIVLLVLSAFSAFIMVCVKITSAINNIPKRSKKSKIQVKLYHLNNVA